MVMDEMKLIAMVRERRLLWSRTDPNYKNNAQKKLIWEDIGRKLNVSGLVAKHKWRNLRDTFAKKCTAMASDPDIKVIGWKYYKQMLFLKEVMEIHPRCVNYPLAREIIKAEHVDVSAEIENSDAEEPPLLANDMPIVSRKRSKNVWHSRSSADPLASLLDQDPREKNEPWREQEMRTTETRKSTNYYFLNSLVDPLDTLPLEVQLSIKEQYTSIMHAALRKNSRTMHSDNL